MNVRQSQSLTHTCNHNGFEINMMLASARLSMFSILLNCELPLLLPCLDFDAFCDAAAQSWSCYML